MVIFERLDEFAERFGDVVAENLNRTEAGVFRCRECGSLDLNPN